MNNKKLTRPLPEDGAADCPSCGCKKTVKRHNADWTCYKCWYHEVVDNDKDLANQITAMLMECVDLFAMNPGIKADPRAWKHLLIYAPKQSND